MFHHQHNWTYIIFPEVLYLVSLAAIWNYLKILWCSRKVSWSFMDFIGSEVPEIILNWIFLGFPKVYWKRSLDSILIRITLYDLLTLNCKFVSSNSSWKNQVSKFYTSNLQVMQRFWMIWKKNFLRIDLTHQNVIMFCFVKTSIFGINLFGSNWFLETLWSNDVTVKLGLDYLCVLMIISRIWTF